MSVVVQFQNLVILSFLKLIGRSRSFDKKYTIADIMEEQVDKTPTICCEFEDKKYTYREMDGSEPDYKLGN